MNCDDCTWFIWREYTPEEKEWMKHHPNCYIVAKYCCLGGCDGSMYRDKEGKKNDRTEKQISKGQL